MTSTPDSWPTGSLMAQLSGEERSAFGALGGERVFAAGDVVVHEGDRGRDLYLLLQGYVKVVSNSQDGRTHLLAVRSRGDLIGEIAALDDRPRTATVVAATRIQARSIDERTFSAFLRRYPAIEVALRRTLLTKLRQATTFRGGLGRASVRQRLALVLLHLVENYGRATGDATTIDVPISQLELAAFVGAGEASVHRTLSGFRTDKLVTTHYRHIVVLDRDGLSAIAVGDADSLA